MKDDYQGVHLGSRPGEGRGKKQHRAGREDLGCKSQVAIHPRTEMTIESYPKLTQETFIDPCLISHWIHTLERGGTMGK